MKTQGRLLVRPLADGRSWALVEIIHVFVSYIFAVAVPAGFVTDFASVPRLLWAWTSPWGRHGLAGVVHDWLYYDQSMSRRHADRIFYVTMLELGVRSSKAWLMWLAVRGPGWFAWKANERRKAKLGENWKMVTDPMDERFELTRQAGRKVK